MIPGNTSRVMQGMTRRGCAQAVAAIGTCSSACSPCQTPARRGVSSQPNLRGLLSTAKEMASLTAQAGLKRKITPLPPLRTALFSSFSKAKKTAPETNATTTTVIRRSFLSGAKAPATTTVAFLSSAVVADVVAGRCLASCTPALRTAKRFYHNSGVAGSTRSLLSPKQQDGANRNNALQGVSSVDRYREEQEEEQRNEQEQGEDPFNRSSGPGYLPFPPPFHTINVIMILFIANVLCYCIMNFGTDDMRDFIVEHFTLSHENFHRIYPILTNAFYQENLLQLLIDCWLLWQFGDTMLAFLGNVRLTFFCFLCTLGGSLIHVARQKFELHYGMDELEVRGRCYGPNPMIMGLISMEGLIFRHLNFIQQPPIPFLVLTAFVMVIDVWRIFTTRPEEHGAATGGALMAYLFWALPTRFLGLDKLTATM